MKNYLENDEDALVRRAVNAAARETEDEGEEPTIDGPPPIAPLMPTGPDVTIYVHADQTKGRYTYRLLDTSTGLSHCCVRVLKEAGTTALSLLAVRNSLASILKSRATELITARYGFSCKSAALASRRRLQVELIVTEPYLADLAETITAPENEDTFDFLPLNEHDRRIWSAVLTQTQRFDVTWGHMAAHDGTIIAIEAWADMTLASAAHGGPIFSFRRNYALPIGAA